MKVILTVEAGDGELSHVDAEGETYEEAKAAAEAGIPEGSRSIAIRTSR
ncbi:hypothetical protein [Arthrobacter sp. fls2-241-R2A-172]|nr:hypothetical protein [Arthrobacter sp. fls2-241-R2A-172]